MADGSGNRRDLGPPPHVRAGEGGYPQLRVLWLVACGIRAVIDAVAGPIGIGTTRTVPTLVDTIGQGVNVLMDRGFPSGALVKSIAGRQAHVLVRLEANMPVYQGTGHPDGSRATTFGETPCRLIEARVAVTDTEGNRIECYRLPNSGDRGAAVALVSVLGVAVSEPDRRHPGTPVPCCILTDLIRQLSFTVVSPTQ